MQKRNVRNIVNSHTVTYCQYYFQSELIKENDSYSKIVIFRRAVQSGNVLFGLQLFILDASCFKSLW